MAWASALKEILREGVKVERSLSEPQLVLRSLLGVALVLLPPLLAGSPGLAASAAAGAFIAGITSFQASYRSRPVLALVAGLGMGVATLLGALTAPYPVLYVIVAATWAFGVGLAWAVGPTSGVVAGYTASMMAVVAVVDVPASAALEHAGIASLGGLVQAVLMVLWPGGRWTAQRNALADAYTSLAEYARDLAEDPHAPFDPSALIAARHAAAVTPHQARRRPKVLHGMRGTADRIRPSLTALAEFADNGRPALLAAAEALDLAAEALRTAEPPKVPQELWGRLEPPVGEPLAGRSVRRLASLLREVFGTLADAERPIEGVRSAEAEESTLRERIRLTRLRQRRKQRSGQWIRRQSRHLVRRWKLADTPPDADAPADGKTGTGGTAPDTSREQEPSYLARPGVFGLVPEALHAIRTHIQVRSPVLRHAVRLFFMVLIVAPLGMFWPLGHGYWVQITAMMVLRPDFAQTYRRGVARLLGTVAGAAVATGVLLVLRPGETASVVLVLLFVFCAYSSIDVGYLAVSACVTAYTVFLIELSGVEEGSAAVVQRIAAALFGGIIALAVYAAWPTWETRRVPDLLADWLRAHGQYGAAVLRRYADPGSRGKRLIRDSLLETRRTLSAVDTALGRAEFEPVRHRAADPEAIDALRAAVAQYARAVLVLEGHLPKTDAEPLPAGAFADEVVAVMDGLAARTAEGAGIELLPVGDLPVPIGGEMDMLYKAYRELAEKLADAPAGSRAQVLLLGAELVVDSLEELVSAVDAVTLP
jgi:uncharacterized membrane protein YccC